MEEKDVERERERELEKGELKKERAIDLES